MAVSDVNSHPGRGGVVGGGDGDKKDDEEEAGYALADSHQERGKAAAAWSPITWIALQLSRI